METFSTEHLNIHTAWSSFAVKRTLESLDGTYCISASDIEVLKACAKNSSYIHENAAASKSPAEFSTVQRVYARTQALLRACRMLSETRVEYWGRAHSANAKDERYYAVQTHSDITTHREFHTVPSEASLVADVVVDAETGEVTASTTVLMGSNLA